MAGFRKIRRIFDCQVKSNYLRQIFIKKYEVYFQDSCETFKLHKFGCHFSCHQKYCRLIGGYSMIKLTYEHINMIKLAY